MNQFELLKNYINNPHLICKITEDGYAQVICQEDGQPLYSVPPPAISGTGKSAYEKILSCIGDQIVCCEVQMGKAITMIMLGSGKNYKVLLNIEHINK